MIEKIFKAYDVRATYPSPLNEDAAWKVGHATGCSSSAAGKNVPAGPAREAARTRSSSAATCDPTRPRWPRH